MHLQTAYDPFRIIDMLLHVSVNLGMGLCERFLLRSCLSIGHARVFLLKDRDGQITGRSR